MFSSLFGSAIPSRPTRRCAYSPSLTKVTHFNSIRIHPSFRCPVVSSLGTRRSSSIRREYFTYKKGKGAGSHAAFSNLFRYKLLADRGGWWVDTDVVCLSSEIPTFDEFFALQEHNVVNGAVLFFRRSDPLMLECLDEALRIGDDPSWGEIGPKLVTRKVEEDGRLRNAQPSLTCYPVHHSEALDLLRPQQFDVMAERIRQSFFLHLWNEVLRRVHVAKTMLPPRGSFLRAIVERHPVDGWSGEYDADVLEHALAVEIELQQLRKEIYALRRQQLQRSERKRQRSDRTTGASKTSKSKLAAVWAATQISFKALARYLAAIGIF